jgi:DNA-binding Lrp family transcriptional regulator
MKPILAIVDVDIHAGKDEIARERLLENLAGYNGSAVTPLWINWLRARADLRVACLVRDLNGLDDFLVSTVRSVAGVRGTGVFLCFSGLVNQDIVEHLPLQDKIWTRRASASVLISTDPGKDDDVYRALTELPQHNQVEVVYVMRMFHCHVCDLVVLLFGERTASLSGYVKSWIRTIPGVNDTTLMSTLDWKVLCDAEDLITLAQCFPGVKETA